MNLNDMMNEFGEIDKSKSYKDIDEVDVCSLHRNMDGEETAVVIINEDGMFEEYGFRDRDAHLGAVEW